MNVYVSFLGRHTGEPPERLSEMLGLVPTEVIYRGSLRSGGNFPAKQSVWRISSKDMMRSRAELGEHLEWLASVLSGVRGEIVLARTAGWDFEVWVYSTSESSNLTLEMPSRISTICGSLDIPVIFDLYFVPHEN